MELPDDADGDALRRLVAMGCDLSRPMTIDFAVDVPSAEAGQAVADLASMAGYRVAVKQDESESGDDDESGDWTCYCEREMIADHAALLEAQAELSRLSGPHGGWCEAWGSIGNAGR